MDRNESLMIEANRLADRLNDRWMSISATWRYLDKLSRVAAHADRRAWRRTARHLFSH